MTPLMAYDLEQQEQMATMKAWWDRWGNLVAGGVTVVMLAVAGWFGWQYWQRTQAVAAATLYEEFVRQSAAKDTRARELAGRLIEKFGRTVYAPLAALTSAKALAEAGDPAGAKVQLRWVVERSGRAELVDLARVRLAGVLLDEKSFDEALQVLEAAPSAAGLTSVQDRRADVLAAQGKFDEARAAYQGALAAAGERHPLRGLIQQKLDALPAGS
jgi:predicted negative regulator of RcsB-dependent stress response